MKKEYSRRAKKYEQTRYIGWIGKVTNVLTALQIVFICIMTLLTMLKAIPNDLNSNKIICSLALFSFSLLFFSVFLNHSVEDAVSSTDNCNIDTIEAIEKYYLTMIEKVKE